MCPQKLKHETPPSYKENIDRNPNVLFHGPMSVQILLIKKKILTNIKQNQIIPTQSNHGDLVKTRNEVNWQQLEAWN